MFELFVRYRRRCTSPDLSRQYTSVHFSPWVCFQDLCWVAHKNASSSHNTPSLSSIHPEPTSGGCGQCNARFPSVILYRCHPAIECRSAMGENVRRWAICCLSAAGRSSKEGLEESFFRWEESWCVSSKSRGDTIISPLTIAYYVAFGPHGPRTPITQPGSSYKIIFGVSCALAATAVVFYGARSMGEFCLSADMVTYSQLTNTSPPTTQNHDEGMAGSI